MGWVRSKLKFGSWFALIALAVQLAAAFGHVHRAGPVGWAAGLAGVERGISQLPGTGDGPKPLGPAPEYCAICAVINLGASMLPAAAPSPAIPTVFSPTSIVIADGIAPAASAHSPFQARAPPRA
jgi:hypothetical protein